MRASPHAIAWLQRALAHEFAAARQFTLQAAVARSTGSGALARFCADGAAEELEHAQRLAAVLLELGAGFGAGAPPLYPVGDAPAEIVAAATATEDTAVALYEVAARACAADATLRALLRGLQAEERDHLEKLRRWPAVAPAAHPIDARRQA
jgi:bacterioferritin (cytochrome b1)